MKRLSLITLIITTAVGTSALAADVGVSVSIGEPGFYGHIDIGDFPAPAVIYRQPVLVAPQAVIGPPIYLRVPPGHRRQWAHHCAEYGACGQRVYFVSEDWYAREYAPRYRGHREHEGGGPPPWAGGHGRGHGRD